MSLVRRDRFAAVRRCILLAGSLLIAAPRLRAQERGAVALDAALSGLGTTARVLVIGAHPDDEDTQLIAYLARARHVETAYLSLTRGDGGQNLIGNQLGEVLGMIRTQELLAARRIDGGRQYFTRAFDFGFSKTLDETLEHWPKDSILLDMVAIVRAFRPHAIIAVWTGTSADGHGHHQFAGVTAREVYDAAADSVRFPASRVGGLRPWATPKFYRGRYRATSTLSFNVGEYDPVAGRSYSEIASISRSQHRSQGQGELAERGARIDGVRLEASRVSDPAAPERGMFDGLDTTWNRFNSVRLPDSARTALDSLAAQEASVRRARDLEHPSRMVAPLAAYVRLLSRAMSGVRCAPLTNVQSREPSCAPLFGDLALSLETTRTRAVNALLNAAGVTVDATAPRELIAERDTVTTTISVYNQGTQPVTVERVALPGEASPSSLVARRAEPDSAFRSRLLYHADVLTVPWWLRFGRRGDTFVQPMQDMVVGDDRIQESGADVVLGIAGVDVPVRAGPIVYRHADPARGEVRRPIATVPEISVLLQHDVEYARANAPFERTVIVSLHSASPSPREVDVALSVPRGAKADTAVRHASLKPFGDVQLYFKVQGRLAPGRDSITAVARLGARTFSQGFVPIEFEHIAPQRYYRPARTYVESVNATFADLRIGYIRGVSDNVPPMLEELGLPVTELDPAALPQTNLSSYTTIVIGPRAYEANPALVANNTVLMRFVNAGGTIVTQYGQFEYAQPAAGILPYPITLVRPADRVTDERAAVRVIDPASPLLARPNKIGEADFAGWVQERSLYMPRTFDKQYHALFSMNDKNDPPNDAAVLVAPVGKGTYVYTTFSFFRQLPAGNPGAARLFINLLSANQSATSRPSSTSSPIRP
ncbi:MAG TPA: PIG-L family deacetylase [Gemmatimonadaceae bacterium]|nr:PIG-L family deacetylase [Gemmatimonadaceae bacterium]